MNPREQPGDDAPKDRDSRIPLVVLWLLISILFVFSHLALAPNMGFVLDDWTNFRNSTAQADFGETMKVALQTHTVRPVTITWTYGLYRLIGDNFTAHWWLSAGANAINLLLIMGIVFRLTGERRTAFLGGLVFLLIPTLSENVNWCTMVISTAACAVPLFLASTLCWILFAQKNAVGWGVASACFYAAGIFGYEIGAFLPLAFATLLKKEHIKKLVPVGAAYVLLAGLYAGWRLTHGFGLVETKTLSTQFAVDFGAIVVNLKNIVHWWIGDYFWGAVLTGYEGFNTFGLWERRVILLGNGVIAWMLGRMLFKQFQHTVPPPKKWTGSRPLWFALVWIVAAHAPSFISYTASRLNYLPAVGVALLVVLVLRRLNVRAWASAVAVVAFAMLTANQGMNKNWSDAGVLNRRVYQHLQAHRAEWQAKKAILYDTRGLAERRAQGLLQDPRYDLSSVAFNGHPEQSGLIRGFGLFGMQELLKGDGPSPEVLLDVECGAKVSGEILKYHVRFDPGKPLERPMSEVYVLEVGALLGAYYE